MRGEVMSIESYLARLNVQGGSIQGANSRVTKLTARQSIRLSPSRKDVHLNMNIDIAYPCLPSDINTFEIRRFLFEPDTPIYKGDYIQYEGFTYLITSHTTDDLYPQAIGEVCKYSFPLKTEETKTIVGKLENGRPKYEIERKEIVIPAVLTSKPYSTADNSSLPLPDGSAVIYFPYKQGDKLPELNFKITHKHSQYKITDWTYDNVERYEDIEYEKGYIEIRLQREANTNVK